jgi:hypothetical protein
MSPLVLRTLTYVRNDQKANPDAFKARVTPLDFCLSWTRVFTLDLT